MIDFGDVAFEAEASRLEVARTRSTVRKNPPPTPASIKGRPRPRTLSITFQISSEHGPALLSAIEEISNEVGGRLEGMHKFAKEDSLTYAATALGSLRAAISKHIPQGDPDYAG